MKAGEALALAATTLGAVSSAAYLVWFAKQGGGCQPPTGGCPSGQVYDYSLCRCVSQQQTYTVDFQIVDKTTQLPFANASVLFGSSLPGVTDSNGVVAFSGIVPGNYPILVSASGYATVSENVSVTATQTSFTVDMTPCTPPAGGCTCGSVWSGSACQCVLQQVGALLSPPSVMFGQNWYAHVNVGPLGNTVLCAGTTSDGVPGNCATCGPDRTAIEVAVQVVDANGAPVCGEKLSGFLSQNYISWSTTDGQTWGHFVLSVDGPKTTDSQGMATFNVTYRIVVDGTKGYNGLCFSGGCGAPACGPSTVTPESFNTVFSALIQGTPFKAATSVSMSSGVFVYYYA